MSLSLLVALVFSSLTACAPRSTPLPPAPDTPTPQQVIIFRSPRDMNLQTGEVPDLQETPVENPAAEPLLPEAIDQDQRAFVNIDLDIHIESNVIMVPEQTTRSDDDLYEQVVIPRRPGVQRQGKDEGCELGERCRIIYIIDPGCGPGLVLIVLRGNMITVLIGCGRGADRDRITRAGAKIDEHIQAPPRPEEIALATAAPQRTQTQAAQATAAQYVAATCAAGTAMALTLTPPGPTATLDPCVALNLTPEECANSGVHAYSYIMESVSEYEYCRFVKPSGEVIGKTISGESSAEIIFFGDSVQLGSVVYSKKSINTYTALLENGETRVIIFNLNGFTIEDRLDTDCGVRSIYSLK